jgi:F-type H+-transporting ATPase subunit b
MIDPAAAHALAQGSGPIEQIALTFGVNWPHLLAQMVSFGIVCTVLYVLAYGPILRMLETRRQQIADGLANAEKIRAELAQIEVERLQVLKQAEAEGRRMIEAAREAAARIEAERRLDATVAAERILMQAQEAAARDHARMLGEVRHEVGRLVVQTAAAVTGKILTADDHRRLAEHMARDLASPT